jgi:ubiquitin-protein ligase
MKFNALLVGPEDTPYEYGMFEFLLKFPNGNIVPLALPSVKTDRVDYPSKAPQYVVALG